MRGGTNALSAPPPGLKNNERPIRFCIGSDCGQPFLRTNSHQRICPACQAKRLSPTRACAQCGRVAVVHGNAKFCSDQCRGRWHGEKKRTNDGKCPRCGTETDRNNSNCGPCKREAKRAEKRRRAARKRGLTTEPYTLGEIAARDKYRCGLCGRKVNMNLTVPHPRAPTRDHIVPTAQGGDDVKANVQLAHFICNSLKRDRGEPQQLLLVG